MGQDVEEESADKLLGRQDHGLPSVSLFSISVGEGNETILEFPNAIVRDGNPMGIATKVIQNCFWTSERRLGVDDPFFFPELGDQSGKAALGHCATAGLTVKVHLPRGECFFEVVDKFTSKDPGHGPDREKISLPPPNPALSCKRKGSRWNYAMEMDVCPQDLVPCMENRSHANFTTQSMLGVPGEFLQSFGYALKQQVEDYFFIA